MNLHDLMERNLKNRRVSLVISIVLAVIFIVSAERVVSILSDYARDADRYEDIRKDAKIEPASGDAGETKEAHSQAEQQTKEGELTEEERARYTVSEALSCVRAEKYEKEGTVRICTAVDLKYLLAEPCVFDFTYLTGRNPDITGWISIPDTNIDYPLLQSRDNADYIRKDPYGQPNNAGSVFVDCRQHFPGDLENVVIYAHNQRNHKMFHDLLYYVEEKFARAHPYITMYDTTGKKYTYQVFSAYKTASTSDTYTFSFKDKQTFADYLEKRLLLSSVDFHVSADAADRIITLSTCTNNFGDGQRYVVHAKLLKTP